MAYTPMSLHDKLAMAMRSYELEQAGKTAEAEALHRQIPLPPYLARIAKEAFGAEVLIASGENLEEANAAFGPDWLSR